MSAGVRTLVRAAASSIASGRPSSRSQICSISDCGVLGAGVDGLRAALKERCGGRGRQRGEGELVLGGEVQRGAAGHDDLVRERRERLSSRGGVEHLLEVVDDEQQLAAGRERCSSSLATRAGSSTAASGRKCAPSGKRSQAVGELEREAGLADPAGAGDREQAHVGVGQQRLRGLEVVLAAEQRRGAAWAAGARAPAVVRRGGSAPSSAGSWARIAASSCWSSRLGSRPRSSISRGGRCGRRRARRPGGRRGRARASAGRGSARGRGARR